MGNRAVILFDNSNESLYLQWNGGRESIEGFLRACRELFPDTKTPFERREMMYSAVHRFFNDPAKPESWGAPSVYRQLGRNFNMASIDNGIYYLNGWGIVGRDYPHDGYQEGNDPKKTKGIYRDVLKTFEREPNLELAYQKMADCEIPGVGLQFELATAKGLPQGRMELSLACQDFTGEVESFAERMTKEILFPVTVRKGSSK